MSAAAEPHGGQQATFPLRALRVVTFGGFIALGFVPSIGQALQQAAFAATLLSAALRVLHERHLPVFAAFELGVAMVVLGDGLVGSVVVPGISASNLDAARRFLVVATSVVIVVHELVLHRLRTTDHTRGVHHHLDLHRTSRSIEGSPKARLVLVIFTLLLLWRYVPAAWQAARIGRLGLTEADNAKQAEPGAGAALLNPLFQGLAMMLPALWVSWFGPRRRWRAATLAVPILVLLLALTTRYVFLIAAAGFLLTGHRTKRQAIKYAAVATVSLAVASWVISATRARGLANTFSAATLKSSSSRLLGSEGVLRTVAQIMNYTGSHGLRQGRSYFSVLIFWIPRSLWSGKPTLLGYWFPREFGLTGFSAGFSAAASFAEDALIDFGFGFGALALVLVGLGFAYYEARGMPRLESSSWGPAFIGCSYGVAYFAARSMTTALINSIGMIAIGLLIGRLAKPPTGHDRDRSTSADRRPDPLGVRPGGTA
ncbi:MAG: hypothetical protein WCI22_04370 [Actinomycetota bacterium]